MCGAAVVALIAGSVVALQHDRPVGDVVGLWLQQTVQAVAAQGNQPDPVRTRTWALAWWAADRATTDAAQAAHPAALAAAVHDVLTALVPTRRAAFDHALTRSPSGRGAAAGHRAADAVLRERQGDGLTSAQVNAPYVPPAPAPGVYRATPPELAPAGQAGEGAARPFLLRATDQFDPGPPAPLGSQTYRRDLAEVQRIGQETSAVRTAEQSDLARFWGPSLVTVLAGAVPAAVAGMVPRDAARLLSQLWRISLDAQLTVYRANAYAWWRPVTALREDDGDPNTPVVPQWLPLLSTPPQPEYPSAHTTIAAAFADVLDARVGPRRTFTLTSPGLPGALRHYSRWQQLVEENVEARVFAGVHFRSSDEVGARLGRRVSSYDLRQAG